MKKGLLITLSLVIIGVLGYLTGNVDQNDILAAIDPSSGKIKWQTAYGKAWTASFPESRCTPMVYRIKA